MASIANFSLLIIFPICFLIMVSPTTSIPLNPNLVPLRKACEHTEDPTFCLNNLAKTPEVVSALQKSSRLPLVIAIAESSLTYARLLRDYTSNKVAREAALKSAYATCAKFYDDSVRQIEMVVKVLKGPEGLGAPGASDDASYSLMLSLDGVNGCNKTLASANVDDRYVKTSSKYMDCYSIAADSVLTDITVNGGKKN